MLLGNAVPSNWKNNFKHLNIYSQNLSLLDHHLISNFLFNIEKLKSRELYFSRNNKLTSQIFFEKKFYSKELDWRVI